MKKTSLFCQKYRQIVPYLVFYSLTKKTSKIKNLILLLFKIYLYELWSSKALIFDSFLRKIKKTNVLEINCSINNETKHKHLTKKWIKIAHLV